MTTAHESHTMSGGMFNFISATCWWPKLSGDIARFVRKCKLCVATSSRNPPEPLIMSRTPLRPFGRLHIDFKKADGINGELLTGTDAFSRWIFAEPTKKMDCKAVMAILERQFETWGRPDVIKSDNGPPFNGQEFHNECRKLGIEVVHSAPYHPQENATAERSHRPMKKTMIIANVCGRNSLKALRKYVSFHNHAPLSRCGLSPFEIITGWKAKTGLPMIRPFKPEWENFWEKDTIEKCKQKAYADKKFGAKYSNIKVGDTVLLKNRFVGTLLPNFNLREYSVTSRTGSHVSIKSLDDQGIVRTAAIHDVKKVWTKEDDLFEENDDIPYGFKNSHSKLNILEQAEFEDFEACFDDPDLSEIEWSEEYIGSENDGREVENSVFTSDDVFLKDFDTISDSRVPLLEATTQQDYGRGKRGKLIPKHLQNYDLSTISVLPNFTD